jgi:hypothetical protein
MIEILVRVMAGPHTGRGRCVVDGGVATVDLPGLDRPRRIPASVVPEWLAALVGLGPRPAVTAPGMLITSTAVLDGLLASGDAPGARTSSIDVPAGWRDLLTRIIECRQGWWRMSVGPFGDDPADSLEIIDAGSAGLWARRPCPPAAADEEIDGRGPLDALTSTTPTAVWTWLSRLPTAHYSRPPERGRRP